MWHCEVGSDLEDGGKRSALEKHSKIFSVASAEQVITVMPGDVCKGAYKLAHRQTDK